MQKSAEKIKAASVSYDTKTKAVASYCTLQLPRGVKGKVAYKHESKEAKILLEHSSWELSYDTKSKDIHGKYKYFLSKDKKTYIKVSQPVPKSDFQKLPGPEVQYQTVLITGRPKLRDVFELKYNFNPNVATYEHTLKMGPDSSGRTNELSLHINSSSKLEGMKLGYKLKTQDPLLHELTLAYARKSGPIAILQSKPSKQLKLKAAVHPKDSTMGLEVQAKPTASSKFAVEFAFKSAYGSKSTGFKLQPLITLVYDK